MLTVQFADHFRQRRSEWLLAAAMLAVGCAYLFFDGLFNNQYFTTMLELMPQHSWGVVVSGLGSMRLIMLWINGRSRVSPYFRCAGAIGGAGLWMTLFTSAVSSVAMVQSTGLWLLFFAFDAVAAFDAAGDAGQAHKRALADRAESDREGSGLRQGMADVEQP